MRREFIRGMNHAAWLGMAFFMLVALFYCVQYHNHVEETKEMYENNDRLRSDVSTLRSNLKACKEERDRWFKRWNAGLRD